MVKVCGKINPADLMTKYLSADINEGHCARLGLQFMGGRAKAAPTLSSILEGNAVWEVAGNGIAAVAADNKLEDEYKGDMEARSQSTINIK